MSKNFQFIWGWCGIGKNKPYPYRLGEKWHGSVYAGGVRLGFLEIRKWCRKDFKNGDE